MTEATSHQKSVACQNGMKLEDGIEPVIIRARQNPSESELSLPSNWRNWLSERGWITLNTDLMGGLLESAILQIADEVGVACPTRRINESIDHLRPRESRLAHPRSLSASYGLGMFPWHTDGAHWIVPPRYLVFGAAEVSNHEELQLLDSRTCQALRSSEAESAPFLVRNGRQSFYATVAERSRPFFRHDPGCMFPIGTAGAALQAEIAASNCSAIIPWQRGLICLLDNWTVLHRRSATAARSKRHIMRVSVREHS